MRALFYLLLLLPVLACLAASNSLPPAGGYGPDPGLRTLNLRVANVRSASGTIWVGIYTSPTDFLDREKARLVPARVTATGVVSIDLPDLVVGKVYALGLFHDLDDNGEFDTNWLGLPAEPWAFSGQLKSRFRLPRFEEVSFVFTGSGDLEPLRLRTWF